MASRIKFEGRLAGGENWKETTEAAVQLERRIDAEDNSENPALGKQKSDLAKGLEMIERVRKRQAAVFRRLKPYRLTHPLKFMNVGSKSTRENFQMCEGSTREFMRLKLLKDVQPGLYKGNTFWLKRMKTYWHYHDPILALYEEKIVATDTRRVGPLLGKLNREVRKFATKIVNFRDMSTAFEQSSMATTHAMNDFIASPEGEAFAEEKTKIECEIRNAHHSISSLEENTAVLVEEVQALQSELRELQETVVVDEYLPFGKDMETLKADESRLAFEHEETIQRLKMFEGLLTHVFKSTREDLRKLRVNWQENGELHKAAPAMAELVQTLKPAKLDTLQKYIGSPMSANAVRTLILQESVFVTSLMRRMEKQFPMI